MTVIPTENQRQVFEIVRDELPEDARPDYRPMNRWYVVSLQADRHTIRDEQAALADRLREEGYKVSVVGDDVKVTRPALDWPDPEE